MKNSKITVLFCFHDGNKNNGGNRSLIDVIDIGKEKYRNIGSFSCKRRVCN